MFSTTFSAWKCDDMLYLIEFNVIFRSIAISSGSLQTIVKPFVKISFQQLRQLGVRKYISHCPATLANAKQRCYVTPAAALIKQYTAHWKILWPSCGRIFDWQQQPVSQQKQKKYSAVNQHRIPVIPEWHINKLVGWTNDRSDRQVSDELYSV